MIEPRRATGLWLALLAGIAVLYAWVSRHYLAVLLVPHGDAWAHLTAIRRTLELGPFPGDLFYGGGATPPYYSLAHIVFAAASRLTGIPPHELWVAAPPLIGAIDLAATFAFLRLLTGDVRVAVLGAAVELLVSVPGPAWAAFSFPNRIAQIPRYLAFWAYTRGRPERRLAWLLGAGVGLGLSLATHLYVGGLCALGLLFLDLALAPRRRPEAAPVLMTLAAGLLVASPWLGNFVFAWLSQPERTEVVFDLARRSWTLDLGSLPLTILDPALAFEALIPALWLPVAVGFVLCLRRFVRGEASAADRYALLAAAGALALVFTPLYGMAVSVLGVWSPRLVLLCPLSLLWALGVTGTHDLLATATLRPALRRLLQVAATSLALWMAIAVYVQFRDPIEAAGAYGEALRATGPLDRWDLGAQLQRTGPLPQVILSDPDTAYALAYLLGSYVVAMPPGHGSPFADHGTRLAAAREFFLPGARSRDMLAVLDRYGVEMVAVAPASAWPQPQAAEILLQRLRRLPELVDTGCCGSVVFLRYVGGKE